MAGKVFSLLLSSRVCSVWGRTQLITVNASAVIFTPGKVLAKISGGVQKKGPISSLSLRYKGSSPARESDERLLPRRFTTAFERKTVLLRLRVFTDQIPDPYRRVVLCLRYFCHDEPLDLYFQQSYAGMTHFVTEKTGFVTEIDSKALREPSPEGLHTGGGAA